MPRTVYPLPPDRIALVAEAADVSARTVRRYLAGDSMLASTMRRIAVALRVGGHAEMVRSAPSVERAA